MSALFIWLNSNEAKLFHLRTHSIHVESAKIHSTQEPVGILNRNPLPTMTEEETFYRQLVQKLEKDEAAKWLLMGPGAGIQHFMQHLQIHHPNLSEKVIGVKKVDQMPDSEILSVGRRYLQNYYLYQKAQ